MSYLLELAAEWAALAGVTWATGMAIEARWLRLDGHPLRGLARWLVGIAAWLAYLLALAALGLYRWEAMALGALVALCGAASAWRKLPRPRLSRPGAGALLALPALLWMTALFVLAASPAVQQDAGVYHLTLPKLYLAAGGFRPVEMNVYSHWPHLVELLFGVALAAQGPALAKLIHFGFGALVLYALYAGARWLLAGRQGAVAGGLAALLFLAQGVTLFSLPLANVDLAVTFFALATALLLCHALRGEAVDRRSLALAGLAAGLLAGTKLNGVVVALAIAAFALPRALRGGLERRLPLRALAARFLVPIGLFALPWPLKAALETGNPFYPFFWQRFGGADWSARLASDFAAWQEGIGRGRAPLDYLLLPWRLLAEAGRGYSRFDGELTPLWFVVLPLALWGAVRCRAARRPLALGGLLALLWAIGPQQLRFLLPALALLCLGAGVALADLVAPLLERRPVALALLAVALPSLTLAPAVGWRHGDGGRPAGWHLRAELHDARRHLAIYTDPRFERRGGRPYPAAIAHLNEATPSEAKVLLVNWNRGFFLERDFLADSFFEASQIGDWLRDAASADEVARRFRARRVTHLLLWNRPLLVSYPPALVALLDDPVRLRWVFGEPTDEWRVGELLP